MIAAVLLAAGKSERMGKFKQLLPIDGKTFVEACADNLLASRVSEVVVVTGHNEQAVRAALMEKPLRIVNNPDYDTGMASSIRRGVESVVIDARGILIALADQPLIGPDVLNQIISEYEHSVPLIMIPTYRGRKGHPIVLDAVLKQELMSIDPGSGLRQITRAHAASVHYLEVDSNSILIDFDSPRDLDLLRKKAR